MSKLAKAPLIEVIFEVRWHVKGPKETQEFQYLHGDLYPLLKDKYPFREIVQDIPIELPLQVPTHRFRSSPQGYPLVQIGRGLLTVNTIDAQYFWDDYESRVLEVMRALAEVYNFKRQVNLVLQYIDLIKFDFADGDLLRFLRENLNINIQQGFYGDKTAVAKGVSLGLSFAIDSGVLNVNIARGKDTHGADGIAIRTTVNSGPMILDHPDNIRQWLNSAHEICSDSFKNMTQGSLYETFKG